MRKKNLKSKNIRKTKRSFKGSGRKKITPRYKRPVSTKAARDILRDYYKKKNKDNVKKATKEMRRDMGSKSSKGHVLQSKSSRSYLYRYRPYSKSPSGPGVYDMHGVDNKHKNYKEKGTYRRIRPYKKKTIKTKRKPKFVDFVRKTLNLN